MELQEQLRNETWKEFLQEFLQKFREELLKKPFVGMPKEILRIKKESLKIFQKEFEATYVRESLKGSLKKSQVKFH